MTNQLMFLPDVDKKKTKKAVEKAFEAYRMYKALVPSWGGPSMNVTAQPVNCDADTIKGQNRDHSAATVIHNYLEATEQKAVVVQRIEAIVNNLPKTEQTILRSTMMKPDDMLDSDTHVMDVVNLGKTKYYEVKWRAMLRVAFALRIEVMEQAGEQKAS